MPRPTLNLKVHRKTVKTVSMPINSVALIALLRNAGYEVPNDACVIFEVPRGGDYSGISLNLHEDTALGFKVFWQETSND